MKNTILATILIGCSFLSAAETLPESTIITCTELSKSAKNIMVARQSGMSMAEMYALVGGNSLVIAVIDYAFETHVRMTQAGRDEAVADFANNVFKMCITELK